MKTEAVFKKTILAASIAMLAACGGSGGDTPPAGTDGTSVGVITGFGSIYTNGEKCDTSGATMTDEGVAITESELGVGDTVEMDRTLNADGTCTAISVAATDELEGYVFEPAVLNPDGTDTINVMGQAVNITLDTVFSSNDIAKDSAAALVAGDIVEVSGFSDGLGNITATRIELKDAGTDIELKGLVTGLDETAKTFTIGGLTIDYSTANGDVPVNLANDLYVEVKQDGAATFDDINTTTTPYFTMSVIKVEVEEDGDMGIDGDENDEIKVQDVISGIGSNPDDALAFSFRGQSYTFDAIETEGDFLFTDLTNGMIVTVEGTIDANGDFVLKEIELIRETTDEVEGLVTAIGDTTVAVEFTDPITSVISTMTFTVNNDTRMIDESDAKLQYFSLLDVQLGNSVKIGYYEQVGTSINIAAELKRK